MKIKIPFKNRFIPLIHNGQKRMTIRTRRMGKVGDRFYVGRKPYKIERVIKSYLIFACETYFKEDGFSSKQDFVDFWKKIHPRKGFDPYQTVYIHRFYEIDL